MIFVPNVESSNVVENKTVCFKKRFISLVL